MVELERFHRILEQGLDRSTHQNAKPSPSYTAKGFYFFLLVTAISYVQEYYLLINFISQEYLEYREWLKNVKQENSTVKITNNNYS